MKKHLITTLFIAFCLFANAEKNAIYENDLTQNTINKIITLSPQNAKRQLETKDSIIIKETIGDKNFKVIPNSLKGVLGVEVWGGDIEQELRIIVYNESGNALTVQVANEGLNPVDMSQYPKGWYILRIVTINDKKEFKIIKE
jgi:hypothetical protein